MTKVRPLIVDGQTILVEVEDIDLQLPAPAEGETLALGDGVVEKVADLRDQITSTCVAVYQSMRSASAAVKPDEVSVEFGVKLGGEAGVPFVAKGTAEASLSITLTWKPNGTALPAPSADQHV
jgi:hypothetical protein